MSWLFYHHMSSYHTTLANSCPDEQALFEYVDELAEGSGDKKIQEHLETCHLCQKHISDMENLANVVNSVCKDLINPQIPKKIGKYRIQSIIDEGGMGKVWKAVDPYLDRPVAIKVMKKHLLGEQRNRERFIREAQTLAHLDHPNIVKIYSCGFESQEMYIVMEFIEGKPLFTPGKSKVTHLDDFLMLTDRVAAAIEAAHAGGVIHRDLKPNNIMVDSRGWLKLLDFGISRQMDMSTTLTYTGELLGTVKYMAPELIEGEEASMRSDIYSFGLIMYEWLSGKSLFQQTQLASLIDQIRANDLIPLQEIRTDIPIELASLINNMTLKDPQKRLCDLKIIRNSLNTFKSPELNTQEPWCPQEVSFTAAHDSNNQANDKLPNKHFQALCEKRKVPKEDMAKVYELALEMQHSLKSIFPRKQKESKPHLSSFKVKKAIRKYKKKHGHKLTLADKLDLIGVLLTGIIFLLIYLAFSLFRA
ncbi:MAG: serine/threonine protein kinase [Planctomycetes bacterium]|nr:serine/threonine protein kinase [Planctomycetota bacterium]